MVIENQTICDIVYDSRKAKENTVFVCLVGAKNDGHNYVNSAYNQGCRLFYCEHKVDLPDDATVVICDNTRIKLAQLSREFFGFPDKKLKIIGITGTKGKTTTSNLIAGVLNNNNLNTAVIGTNGIIINGKRTPTVNTTPESYELFSAFKNMVDCGVEYCVMEVSSQASKLNRIYGIEFDIGLFTNLGVDHIGHGEHKDFEEYKSCKGYLFEHSSVSVINKDDEYADYFIGRAKNKYYTYSVKDGDYTATDIKKFSNNNSLGMKFICKNNSTLCELMISTPGLFSVYNALSVYAVANLCGLNSVQISSVMPKLSVKGRFEIIDALPYATIIIDYAHNALSLKSVLKTLKEYDPKRLVAVFGSVGDRTQIRRKELAEVASEYADFIVLTSDNPGFEEPDKIIDEIASYIKNKPYRKFANREDAISYVISNAMPDDVIIFAGKGHEDYQLIKDVKVPFNEKELILLAASKVKSKNKI